MDKPADDGLRDFGAATPDELQRAHDVLHAIVAGEVRVCNLLSSYVLLHATHDALSWVLGFPCGETFRKVLNSAVHEMRAQGLKAWRSHPPA